MADLRPGIIRSFYRDRPLAHAVLFRHRHKNETPAFHSEMIADFHARIPLLGWKAFRGSAKSTRMEEAVALGACLREFRFCLIVGTSLEKACERLHSIRRQFEKNEMLRQTFGDLVGSPWGDDKIELTSGVVIKAMGRGQAIRGTKGEDDRPDLMVADDIEDAESLRTPEGREKVRSWFFGELMPSGDEPNLRVRILANDMHPECLINQLAHPDSGFVIKTYPIEHLDLETAARVATWADRYPLEWIDRKRKQLYSQGRAAEFDREYMCRSEVAATKTFRPEMLRVEPRVKTWQAVYTMHDPARSVGTKSATTGFAAWSWVGAKLVIWDAWGKFLMPDEIIASMFEENDRLSPVYMGIEKDGLAEWLMQPLRQEQARRGIMLPVEGVKAPNGKLDFIRALQPFFSAREVEFAKDLPDLKAQLLGFPSGLIDVPNALAYALKLRPGAPFYEDFSQQNILQDLELVRGRPAYLALNAEPSLVTAVLMQIGEGTIRIAADWVREGDPTVLLGDIVREARLEAAQAVRLVAGPKHFERYNSVGLVQAAKRLPIEVRRAPGAEVGRPEIQAHLKRQSRGAPALLVSDAARWTLNGLAGGYCREALKTGALADYAKEGPYRTLIEGMESFCGLFRAGSTDDEESGINYGYTADGRRFISARAVRS